MAFNTGNPIGSTDPRDFSDNSENLDRAVNNTASATWTDRFGNTRTSIAGQIGYIGTGVDGAIEDYEAGQELTTFSTIIRYSGEFYRPAAGVSLPYTTTATTPDVDANLVSVGDATLRQDLADNASTAGTDLVAHTGTPDTVTEALNKRTIYVGSVSEIEALSLDAGFSVYLTESERAGEGVIKSGTPPSDPEKAIYITIANGNYWERLEKTPYLTTWFGASTANTKAQNKTALQAAITLADSEGVGKVVNPSTIDYGLVNNDLTTYPDFSGVSTTDMVVEDYGVADGDGAGNKSGAQARFFFHTVQTSPAGMHNGNGQRIHGDWNPYHWIENNANYAPQGDPSRTAADNRRASLFFANDGDATWRVGQGTQNGDLTDEEMSNFVIQSFNAPIGNLTPLIVQRSTGNASYGGGTNAPPASHHFKSPSIGYATQMIESLTTICTSILRNSNGSAEDIHVRNNLGEFEVFVPGVGSAMNIGGSDRQVTINELLTLPEKTVAGLPSASSYTATLVYVTDATGGAAPAYSNGTDWISLLTGSAV